MVNRTLIEGQLVIPTRLRRRFAIKRVTRVTFVEDDGRLIVQQVQHAPVSQVRGSSA
jgi:bifunctional DNA-binding transcriptional regulator/antitoxin component of YhaV-PrlF toxin-antitoxin module